jgi:hypothetical protein
MLRLQIVSDLHLEHRDLDFETVIHQEAEVIGLLGDIGSPFSENYAKLIKWCSDRFLYVLVISGNHEYYNRDGIPISDIDTIIHNICKQHENVSYLNNSVFELDNIVFVGSTLWSWIPTEQIIPVWNKMNDYRLIYTAKNELLTPMTSRSMFINNMTYVYNHVIKAHHDNKTCIVLTHHCPSLEHTSHPSFDRCGTNVAFATDLPLGMFHGAGIHVWCSGHTHHNFKINVHGYDIISNQYGYGQKAIPGYKKAMHINIE